MRPRVLALLLAMPLLTGCGGATPRTAAHTSERTAAPGFLSASALSGELGTGFRRGLYRVAVMSQPGDRASDLGQPLPTGTARDVACRAAGRRPPTGSWPWACSVRWKTVAGGPRRERYRVRLSDRGCFTAAAQPRLGEIYDATTRNYAVHPLDVLSSVRRGC